MSEPVVLRILGSTSSAFFGQGNMFLFGFEPPSDALSRFVMCFPPDVQGIRCANGIGEARTSVVDHPYDAYTVRVLQSGPVPARVVVGFADHGSNHVYNTYRSGPGAIVSGYVPGNYLDLLVFLDFNGATWADVEIRTGAPVA